MSRTVEEIGAKMDALGLWEAVAPYNWAVKPRGTALPYFCTVVLGEKGSPLKARFLMLEGWQTMHDYVHTRVDRNYGYYSSPAEMPHLEMIFVSGGQCKLFRYDTGFQPQEADARWRDLAEKLRAEYNDRIHCLHRAGKMGLGSAYKEGFKRLLKKARMFWRIRMIIRRFSVKRMRQGKWCLCGCVFIP